MKVSQKTDLQKTFQHKNNQAYFYVSQNGLPTWIISVFF